MANSKIYLGSTNIGSLFQGADDISIYLGDEKVYPLGEPTLKWKATYQDSHVESAECDSSSAITDGEIDKIDLVSVEIGDCVTSIGDSTFLNCTSLTSIDIPDSVTSIGNWAFNGCTSLTNITIPSGVTSIRLSAFNYCSGLTSIDIPSGVTSIGDSAFANCMSLTSIDIPDSVTSIGGNAFEDCSSLTSITVNATTPPTLGSMTFDDTNDCPIYVPCESVEAYKSASGWSDYASRIQAIQGSCPKLLATYQGGTTRKVDCNGNSSLYLAETKPDGYQYTAMTDVIIGDCVTSFASVLFYGCTSLSSVTIPNSVTYLDDSTFEGCSSLRSITLPSGITEIDYNVFTDCSSLTGLTIPSGVTSIGNNAFASCTSLASIVIPSNVSTIGNQAFVSCSGLTSVTVNASTPPTLGVRVFNGTNNCPIYVPSGKVNTYKAASGWSDYASRIQAIP